jgi:hypothetical protein
MIASVVSPKILVDLNKRRTMIIKYKHHGREVFVQEELKGKHREHCLKNESKKP